MPILVGWTLVVVLQLPNSSFLQGVGQPEHNLTLEQCIKKAAEIMSDFSTPKLAMCSPMYRKIVGDST